MADHRDHCCADLLHATTATTLATILNRYLMRTDKMNKGDGRKAVFVKNNGSGRKRGAGKRRGVLRSRKY
jgi:hypothetical protein